MIYCLINVSVKKITMNTRRNHISLLTRHNLRKRSFNDIEVIYKIGQDPLEDEDYQFIISNVPKNANDADIVQSLSTYGQIQKIRSCFLSQTNRREPVILVKYSNPSNIIQLLNNRAMIVWNVISCTELKNVKSILATSYMRNKDFDDIYSEFENKLYGNPVMHRLSTRDDAEFGFLGFTFAKSINANLSCYNLCRKNIKIFRRSMGAVALVQRLPVLF